MPSETKPTDDAEPVAETPAAKVPPAVAALEAEKPELKRGNVWGRVLKKGHDKIYTGATKVPDTIDDDGRPHFVGTDLFERHPFGAIIQLPYAVALAQEDNGFFEIQETEE